MVESGSQQVKPKSQIFVTFQRRHVRLAQFRLDAVQGGLVQHGQRGHNDGQGFQEQTTFGVNASDNLKDTGRKYLHDANITA
jgi:hypothetical protein